MTTFTGLLNSSPLMLPQRHLLNAGLAGISGAGLIGLLACGDPSLYGAGLATLLGGAALAGGVSGLTLTAAIGGQSVCVCVDSFVIRLTYS